MKRAGEMESGRAGEFEKTKIGKREEIDRTKAMSCRCEALSRAAEQSKDTVRSLVFFNDSLCPLWFNFNNK